MPSNQADNQTDNQQTDNHSEWFEKRTRQRALYPRQREALTLFARAFTYRQIAEQMEISVGTARSYVGGAALALGADNPTHAVEIALERGELDDDSDSDSTEPETADPGDHDES